MLIRSIATAIAEFVTPTYYEDKSPTVLEKAATMIHNKHLDPFGNLMIEQATAFLKSKRFNLEIDNPRAQQLSLLNNETDTLNW